MAWEIDNVTLDDVVRELCPEALEYFVGIELSADWPAYEKTDHCKFVRLGEVIILGAAIKYGPRERDGSRHQLQHADLLEWALCGPTTDLSERITATSPRGGSYLANRWPLMDAGHTFICKDNTGRPDRLLMLQDSFDFGRGNQSERQRTGEIAQFVLGAAFEVDAE